MGAFSNEVRLTQSLETALKNISKEDIEASATLNLFRLNRRLCLKLMKTLSAHLPLERERMLHLGCGYGGLSKLISNILGFKEVYGVDLDKQRIAVAESRSLRVFNLDLERDPLPFPPNYFDLVTSLGVLEHLKFYDNLIIEAHRVLKPKGLLLLSTTNLASWVNRFVMLFGYQPRNLEISRHVVVGAHGMYYRCYATLKPVGHTSGATYRALKELLNFYGFTIVKSLGGGMVPSPDIKDDTIGKIVGFMTLYSQKSRLYQYASLYSLRRVGDRLLWLSY